MTIPGTQHRNLCNEAPLSRFLTLSTPPRVITQRKVSSDFLRTYRLTHILPSAQSRNDRSGMRLSKESLLSKRVSPPKPTGSPMSRLEMSLMSKLVQNPTPHSRARLELTSDPMPRLAAKSMRESKLRFMPKLMLKLAMGLVLKNNADLLPIRRQARYQARDETKKQARLFTV